MSKTEKVLNYLMTGKMISESHAKHRFNVPRLSSVIWYLREKGYDITTYQNKMGRLAYFLDDIYLTGNSREQQRLKSIHI